MSLMLDRRLRAAVWVWAVLIVVVCVRPLLQPGRSDLTLLWAQAGRAWLDGVGPYRTANDFESFRYSPLAAALCVPLGVLPAWAGAVAWRLFSAAVLLGGLRAWLRRAAPGHLDAGQAGWLLLLLAPLSLGCLNNGQSNAVLAGLMLFAVADAARRWDNRAALWLALAAWLKVYPLALALLLALAYPRRLGVRLLGALCLLGVAPFLLQSPAYVAEQYATWLDVIGTSDSHRRFLPIEKAYRDLLLLLRLWQIPITTAGYALLQLAGGAACVVVVLDGLRCGLPERRLLLRLLVCACGWMMLLGPATESNTYILFAPLACWLAVSAHAVGPPAARYLAGNAIGLLLLCLAGVAVPAGRTLYHAGGLQPLAVILLLAAYVLTERAVATPPPITAPRRRARRIAAPQEAVHEGSLA